MTIHQIYAQNKVVPYEHRGKAISSLASRHPPAITELILALSVERDMALRKCIVNTLLKVTKSVDVRELKCNLSSIAARLPSEAELTEVMAWRLPY